MSIDPKRLRSAIALLTGTAPGAEESEDLARKLGVVEEVLPWMVLRGNALADLPEFRELLDNAAKQVATPVTRRQPAHGNSRLSLALAYEIEDSLKALINDNVEGASLALAADSLIARQVRAMPAGDRLDGQNRIAVDMPKTRHQNGAN